MLIKHVDLEVLAFSRSLWDWAVTFRTWGISHVYWVGDCPSSQCYIFLHDLYNRVKWILLTLASSWLGPRRVLVKSEERVESELRDLFSPAGLRKDDCPPQRQWLLSMAFSLWWHKLTFPLTPQPQDGKGLQGYPIIPVFPSLCAQLQRPSRSIQFDCAACSEGTRLKHPYNRIINIVVI